jgi:hypothetical protein
MCPNVLLLIIENNYCNKLTLTAKTSDIKSKTFTTGCNYCQLINWLNILRYILNLYFERVVSCPWRSKKRRVRNLPMKILFKVQRYYRRVITNNKYVWWENPIKYSNYTGGRRGMRMNGFIWRIYQSKNNIYLQTTLILNSRKH